MFFYVQTLTFLEALDRTKAASDNNIFHKRQRGIISKRSAARINSQMVSLPETSLKIISLEYIRTLAHVEQFNFTFFFVFIPCDFFLYI